MEALKIFGTYGVKEKTSHLSIDRSENISAQQIAMICEEMIQKDISNLTLDFENENFIYFHNFQSRIRFVEGHKTEYTTLQRHVRDDLDGSIFLPEDSQSHVPANDKVIEEKTAPSNQRQSDASIIHHSLFQSIDQFKKSYSEAEIYFEPLVAPGGDFFWYKDYQYKSLAVVGDCTGHGMEGAMIAMSAMTLLKQLFRLPPTSLEESVYEYHTSFKGLMEEEQKGVFDLEVGMILLDKRTKELTYMGSGINLIIKNKDSVKEYASRKARITSKKQKSTKIKLEAGDQLFLCCDGIVDQFDKLDKSKLGRKKLMTIIKELPFPATKSQFIDSFNIFRGDTRPLDDQTMLLLTV